MARKRQVKHFRRSKTGKIFVAGSKIPVSTQRTIVKEQLSEYAQHLKKTGRVKIPELGVLRIKVRKARPARWGTNPFTGEKQKFHAKPRSKLVKFRASKDLMKLL